MEVTHVRLERESTGSWITFKLKRRTRTNALDRLCDKVMPKWEWVTGSVGDPDYTDLIITGTVDGPLQCEPWRSKEWDGRIWEDRLGPSTTTS